MFPMHNAIVAASPVMATVEAKLATLGTWIQSEYRVVGRTVDDHVQIETRSGVAEYSLITGRKRHAPAHYTSFSTLLDVGALKSLPVGAVAR